MPYSPSIFISYSHLDAEYAAEFEQQLKPLAANAEIRMWIDKDEIRASEDWRQEILDGLRDADIGIVLVSENSMASPFIREFEVPALIRARESNQLDLAPLYLKELHRSQLEITVDGEKVSLRKYQGLNDPAMPLLAAERGSNERQKIYNRALDELTGLLDRLPKAPDKPVSNAPAKPALAVEMVSDGRHDVGDGASEASLMAPRATHETSGMPDRPILTVQLWREKGISEHGDEDTIYRIYFDSDGRRCDPGFQVAGTPWSTVSQAIQPWLDGPPSDKNSVGCGDAMAELLFGAHGQQVASHVVGSLQGSPTRDPLLTAVRVRIYTTDADLNKLPWQFTALGGSGSAIRVGVSNIVATARRLLVLASMWSSPSRRRRPYSFRRAQIH